MTWTALGEALAAEGLAPVGAFHPGPDDGAPPGAATLVLVGADGAAMWPAFAASPEHADGRPHPLDRWSRRILDRVAADLGARPVYPFDGPPWPPFVRWAMRGEGSRVSPVAMPVSPVRGLWASYRGALVLSETIDLPPRSAGDPCGPCPQPCRSSCPVGAFAGGRYDVAVCVAHVETPEGAACQDGCLVRRACPVGRPPPVVQRRFHMAAFLAARPGRERPIDEAGVPS